MSVSPAAVLVAAVIVVGFALAIATLAVIVIEVRRAERREVRP
jgi:hypothetical protein